MFIASGCDCWNNPTAYPETFGWQLDYIREGKILGAYVKQHFPGKKIGFFYQNDEFGLDGVKGLSYEIPSSQIVAKQSYVPTNVNIGPAVAALKAAGAQVVVSFAIPAFNALFKLASLKLSYGPDHPRRAAGGLRQAGRREGQRQCAHPGNHHRRLPAHAGQRHQQLDRPVQEDPRHL